MSKVSEITLGDLIEFQRGYDLPKSQFIDGKYPVQSSNGILGYHNEYMIEGPGITIGRSGTVGLPHLIKSNFYPHNTTLFIKNFKGNDVEYIFYLLKNLKLGDKKSGSGVPTMNRNHLHPLKIIAHLDLPTQKAIAKVLSDLDAKIELNNRINKELEAMAKTLYDYWFVQFDFPNEQGKPYKSSGGKMLYNAELKREIPVGWEVKNLKKNSLTQLIKPKINEFDGEKIYLATADVQNKDINFQAEKITFIKRPSRANMQPIKNSVWFAKMKKSKKVLFFGDYSDDFLNKFILSTGFAGLKCENDFYLEYIWGFIDSDTFETTKDKLANGATQEAINNDSMIFINLIIPSDEVLKKYHSTTKSVYQKIYNNQKQNQQLTALRDWLLPMLMNGQVSVKEAEENLSMAAEPQAEYKKG